MKPATQYYALELGTFPALSATEIAYLLPQEKLACIHPELLTVTLPSDRALALMEQAAGIVRVIQIMNHPVSYSTLEGKIIEYLQQAMNNGHKCNLGLSYFPLPGANNTLDLAALAYRIKSALSQGLSLRYLLPAEGKYQLSAATVINNELTTSQGNLELCIIQTQAEHYILGTTTAIQDINWFSKRDIGRPERLRAQGMIPTKLARCMVNIAMGDRTHDENLVLDPFCGSGTIIQEALLRGYDALGSDIDKQSLSACEHNLDWLARQPETTVLRQPLTEKFSLLTLDATKLTSVISPASLDAIITEGYLGPLFSEPPSSSELQHLVTNLTKLYRSFFAESFSVLKPSGTLVITLPYWAQSHTSLYLNLIDDIMKIGYTNLAFSDIIRDTNLTQRGSYLYTRSDHVVGRELIILEKRV
jgi:tRNA G10  N-methylase Trm11